MTPNDRECVNPGRGTVAAGLADRGATRTNREITSTLVIGDAGGPHRSLENGDAGSAYGEDTVRRASVERSNDRLCERDLKGISFSLKGSVYSSGRKN
ncbi:unnamed protein product [Lasius platythorax]|uniref:Uncharacterized protein n=1 Tax=Lasius platythorax TaxID=488582 RepID=A0AAV2NP85_9HYME